MPEFLDWPNASAPDDVIRHAVQTLQHGRLLLMPTEVGAVLAGLPSFFPDQESLARWTPLPVERLLAYDTSTDWAMHNPDVTPVELALAQRLWPSAIVLTRPTACPAWSPRHPVAGALLAQGQPLAVFRRCDGQPWSNDDLGDAVGLVIRVGEANEVSEQPLTEVWLNDRAWHVTLVGSVPEHVIRERLARQIVFVCTGNTCRSPMVEAVFKQRLAAALNCASAELPNRGYVVRSAGVATADGHPASAEAVDVLRAWDIDLSQHRSQIATAELIAQADEIVAMTRSHLLTILSRYPVLPGSLRLLCGVEGDLDDPIGGTVEVYRTCAEKVRRHVDRFITEMGLS